MLPIVMVTARVDDVEWRLGFLIVANDYVDKPFSPKDVMAGLAAVLRHA